jgi:hypothetical protein
MQNVTPQSSPDGISAALKFESRWAVVLRAARFIYRNSKRLLILNLFAQFIVLVAVVCGLLIWDVHKERIVQSSQSAGLYVAAGWQANGSKGWVQTDSGMYFVKTPLSSGFQEGLWIQTRAQGSRFLCDGRGHCTRVLD